jgi:hypothetical protein
VADAEADAPKYDDGCVIQLHQPAEESFLSWVKKHGFRVLTIARHPFDVLISILHFCRHEPSSARWLDGKHGTERDIWQATPRSPAFLNYATGPRAKALLAVSTDWWGRKDVLRTRYETFVEDPEGELGRLTRGLGAAGADIAGVVRAHAIENLRPQASNHHFWQGRPGLWRSLLTVAEVRELVAAHAKTLSTYGYAAEADVSLTPAKADANWATLLAPAVRKAA